MLDVVTSKYKEDINWINQSDREDIDNEFTGGVKRNKMTWICERIWAEKETFLDNFKTKYEK